jgi:hypothetical protein
MARIMRLRRSFPYRCSSSRVFIRRQAASHAASARLTSAITASHDDRPASATKTGFASSAEIQSTSPAAQESVPGATAARLAARMNCKTNLFHAPWSMMM